MPGFAGAMALASLFGTGLKIAGQVRQGQEMKRISFENAEMARYAAGDAVARGSYEVFKRRVESARLRGQQRAAIAGSGVAVGAGSAAMVEFDAMIAADLDAMVLSNNAAREAWGLGKQAEEFERTGRRAMADSILGSVGTGVSGAMSAYRAYQTANPKKGGS